MIEGFLNLIGINEVKSVEKEFYLSTSKYEQIGGSWSTICPAWVMGMYLWEHMKTIYTDGKVTYTGLSCSSEWDVINGIIIGGVNTYNNYGNKTKPVRQGGTAVLQYRGTLNGVNVAEECIYGFAITGKEGNDSGIRIPHVITSNGEWVVSFDIKGNQDVKVGFSVDICDSLPVVRCNSTNDNLWKHIEITAKVNNYSDVYNFVDFGNIDWAYIYIRNLKIEKGNKATSFTLSPDDQNYQSELLKRNYILKSRFDSTDGWRTSPYPYLVGQCTIKNDPYYGKVVHYARTQGDGEFIKNFTIADINTIQDDDFILYVIAKPALGGYFQFGGWQKSFNAVTSESDYIDLQYGWKLYYSKVQRNGIVDDTSSYTFGMNSIQGTVDFYACGLVRGNVHPCSWIAAPEDINSAIEEIPKFLRDEYYLSKNEVSLVGGSWSTERPDWQPLRYAFHRAVYLQNGETVYKPSADGESIQGSYGKQGAKMIWKEWDDTDDWFSGENGEQKMYMTMYLNKPYLCTKSFTKVQANATETMPYWDGNPKNSVESYDGHFIVSDEMFVAFIRYLFVHNLTADYLNIDNMDARDINVISGKIGGFLLANGKIGSDATPGGDGGDLAIYKDFIRVGGSDSYVMFGNNVIPSFASAFTAAGRIVNNKDTHGGSYGYDRANYGLLIEVSGGTKNYGILSNAALRGSCCYGTTYKEVAISSTYSLDFSQSNVLILNANSTYSVNLPSESQVAKQFGYSSLPDNFAFEFTLILKKGSANININDIYNSNYDKVSPAMGQGDVIKLLAIKNGTIGFHYKEITHIL